MSCFSYSRKRRITKSHEFHAAAVLALASVVLACSGGDGTVGGAATSARVGQACSASQACGPAERCLAEEPGGLCVTSCTKSGSTAECPTGATCDEDSFVEDGRDQKLTVCLQSCTKDEDCRTDYACSGVSKANGKVCRKRGS